MPTLAWCATLNNWTEEEQTILLTPRVELQYIIIGRETAPDTGTPHLQIYFQLTRQVKLTTIKNWGGPWARMHIENARGSDEENYNYCTKEGNFNEMGTRKKMGKRGARNDLEEVQQDIDKGMSYDELCEKHFDKCAKYGSFFQQRINARRSKAQKEASIEELESSCTAQWQMDMIDICTNQAPDPRKVYWIWSEGGQMGKSSLATLLGSKYGAVTYDVMKKDDLALIWTTKGPSKIAVFDLPRSVEEKIDYLYGFVECLKNGRVGSGKYHSTIEYFPRPHVIFFANFKPNMTLWSADRYIVIKLD